MGQASCKENAEAVKDMVKTEEEDPSCLGSLLKRWFPRPLPKENSDDPNRLSFGCRNINNHDLSYLAQKHLPRTQCDQALRYTAPEATQQLLEATNASFVTTTEAWVTFSNWLEQMPVCNASNQTVVQEDPMGGEDHSSDRHPKDYEKIPDDIETRWEHQQTAIAFGDLHCIEDGIEFPLADGSSALWLTPTIQRPFTGNNNVKAPRTTARVRNRRRVRGVAQETSRNGLRGAQGKTDNILRHYCDIPGCGQSYYRAEYLQQHIARHRVVNGSCAKGTLPADAFNISLRNYFPDSTGTSITLSELSGMADRAPTLDDTTFNPHSSAELTRSTVSLQRMALDASSTQTLVRDTL